MKRLTLAALAVFISANANALSEAEVDQSANRVLEFCTAISRTYSTLTVGDSLRLGTKTREYCLEGAQTAPGIKQEFADKVNAELSRIDNENVAKKEKFYYLLAMRQGIELEKSELVLLGVSNANAF
ncbi:TPA: hypothetical protein QH074_004295 [Enterobacter hormaechei subsp. steigerwaltii]|nr:hypothetical protein [Enterobacter hormaechei subsp. steigerwaltii]